MPTMEEAGAIIALQYKRLALVLHLYLIVSMMLQKLTSILVLKKTKLGVLQFGIQTNILLSPFNSMKMLRERKNNKF